MLPEKMQIFLLAVYRFPKITLKIKIRINNRIGKIKITNTLEFISCDFFIPETTSCLYVLFVNSLLT